jgi:hypothetical protein
MLQWQETLEADMGLGAGEDKWTFSWGGFGGVDGAEAATPAQLALDEAIPSMAPSEIRILRQAEISKS